jgi:hypothetical protein
MALGKSKAVWHIPQTIIESKDLQKRLGLDENALRELAARHKLPFQFSALVGMYVHRRFLPWWDAAARK